MHNKSGAINDYFDLLDAQDSLLEGPKAIRKFYDAITSIDNPKDFQECSNHGSLKINMTIFRGSKK